MHAQSKHRCRQDSPVQSLKHFCGKTTITNEFIEIARKIDVTVLTGWYLSDAAVRCSPFLLKPLTHTCAELEHSIFCCGSATGSWLVANKNKPSWWARKTGFKLWLLLSHNIWAANFMYAKLIVYKHSERIKLANTFKAVKGKSICKVLSFSLLMFNLTKHRKSDCIGTVN